MEYKSGYKYQLESNFFTDLPFKSERVVNADFIVLSGSTLMIEKGYAWDGPSGPTIDTKNFMRGSLVHDALYQLMRAALLPIEHRDAADRLLQKMCKEDGMSSIRAWWVYQGVSRFGQKNAMAGMKKEVHIAP